MNLLQASVAFYTLLWKIDYRMLTSTYIYNIKCLSHALISNFNISKEYHKWNKIGSRLSNQSANTEIHGGWGESPQLKIYFYCKVPFTYQDYGLNPIETFPPKQIVIKVNQSFSFFFFFYILKVFLKSKCQSKSFHRSFLSKLSLHYK